MQHDTATPRCAIIGFPGDGITFEVDGNAAPIVMVLATVVRRDLITLRPLIIWIFPDALLTFTFSLQYILRKADTKVFQMKTAEIINLERYPLNNLDSNEGIEFIGSIRESMQHDGSCTLGEFVSDATRLKMVEQADALAEFAFPGPSEVSPYFFNYRIGEQHKSDDTHPTQRKGRRNLSQVAADLIPPEHLLYQLYRSPLMTDFLGRVLRVPVYRNQDRYQSLNISVMDSGGCQQWHFDGGNMVTTLLLQAPEEGGDFEYVPNIRTEGNENFDMVRSVLDGESNQVKSLNLKPGTLSLFRGHYSLHRVTETAGSVRRLQAILGYTTQPDFVGSLDSSILHYGPRVADLENSVAG